MPYAIAGIGALVMRSALHMGCRRIGTAGAGSWMVGIGAAGMSRVAVSVSVAYGPTYGRKYRRLLHLRKRARRT